MLVDLVKKAKALGCKVGLYNHGGWGGEPANMIAVCEWLRDHVEGAIMGEVVGMAASICGNRNTTPRGVYEKHLDELKTLMKV